MKHPEPLTSGDFTESAEPIALFAAWLTEATQTEPADANAMSLATVDAGGMPNVRIVLLKGFDDDGFVFYTNTESRKGHELKANPLGALSFHWKSLMRQVRIRGRVETVTTAEADAYYASRPRLSQIGAWASEQSRPLESRLAFESAVARVTKQYEGATIPRPPHWSGFRIVPLSMEFWHDRPFRLHDRVEFTRADASAAWHKTRLFP